MWAWIERRYPRLHRHLPEEPPLRPGQLEWRRYTMGRPAHFGAGPTHTMLGGMVKVNEAAALVTATGSSSPRLAQTLTRGSPVHIP